MHWAAIVADKERTLLKLCGQFSQACFAGKIENGIVGGMKFILQLLIEGYVALATDEQDLGV